MLLVHLPGTTYSADGQVKPEIHVDLRCWTFLYALQITPVWFRCISGETHKMSIREVVFSTVLSFVTSIFFFLCGQVLIGWNLSNCESLRYGFQPYMKDHRAWVLLNVSTRTLGIVYSIILFQLANHQLRHPATSSRWLIVAGHFYFLRGFRAYIQLNILILSPLKKNDHWGAKRNTY